MGRLISGRAFADHCTLIGDGPAKGRGPVLRTAGVDNEPDGTLSGSTAWLHEDGQAVSGRAVEALLVAGISPGVATAQVTGGHAAAAGRRSPAAPALAPGQFIDFLRFLVRMSTALLWFPCITRLTRRLRSEIPDHRACRTRATS